MTKCLAELKSLNLSVWLLKTYLSHFGLLSILMSQIILLKSCFQISSIPFTSMAVPPKMFFIYCVFFILLPHVLGVRSVVGDDNTLQWQRENEISSYHRHQWLPLSSVLDGSIMMCSRSEKKYLEAN